MFELFTPVVTRSDSERYTMKNYNIHSMQPSERALNSASSMDSPN